MKPDTAVIADKYRDHLYSAAFAVCRNAADAEDAVQETLLRYHTTDKQFESEQHVLAWLLRVAINQAKNICFSFRRRVLVPLEDYADTLTFETPEDRNLFAEVMKLPEKYRIVIHLFYYEDYSVREIAQIVKIGEGNVRVRLNRGRKLLRNALQEEWSSDDEQG